MNTRKRIERIDTKQKRDIQEGIQEYESRDNLSCSSCIFYDKGFCEKGLLMTENCPEYWD